MSNPIKDLMGPTRLPFLILTPACVVLGWGTAHWCQGHINVFHLVLALIGATCAHISVNAFNEYFDFKTALISKPGAPLSAAAAAEPCPKSRNSYLIPWPWLGPHLSSQPLSAFIFCIKWVYGCCRWAFWGFFWSMPIPPGWPTIRSYA